MITAATVATALARVEDRIERAGGRDITIVCVTKGFGVDAIDAVRAAGRLDIGESYAQELVTKTEAVRGLRVHFIGHLQSNKVRQLAPTVSVYQSVDRVSVIDELVRRHPGASVLIQVNSSEEPTKGGCRPADAAALVERARRGGLEVLGLMTIGRTGPSVDAGPGFALTRRLVDDLGLAVCSMGMTDDLEVAVEHGSTMVRVGSALFGPRPVR